CLGRFCGVGFCAFGKLGVLTIEEVWPGMASFYTIFRGIARVMKDFRTVSALKTVFAMAVVLGLAGCPPVEEAPVRVEAPEVGPETTIGSLVEVFSFDAMLVEGYSIVGGLSGTGSSD